MWWEIKIRIIIYKIWRIAVWIFERHYWYEWKMLAVVGILFTPDGLLEFSVYAQGELLTGQKLNNPVH